MEWFSDDPKHLERVLIILAVALSAGAVFLGRKRLWVAIPIALVFFLLAAIAIPGLVPARSEAQRAACITNLRAIEKAKIEWANKNNQAVRDIPAESDICGGTNGILKQCPECPRGGVYQIGAIDEHPTCTLSNKGHRLE